ncbi:hypothetical protein JCM19992_05920 [Thermostilla marina]
MRKKNNGEENRSPDPTGWGSKTNPCLSFYQPRPVLPGDGAEKPSFDRAIAENSDMVCGNASSFPLDTSPLEPVRVSRGYFRRLGTPQETHNREPKPVAR